MIPILGALVLNRPDLLERMISSIDYPVDKLAIVQNSSDPAVSAVVDKITKTKHPFINTVYVERPFRNLGCGPGWNSIVKGFPECQYWLIANNDHVFLKGDLEKFDSLIKQNPNRFVAAQTGSFSAFALSQEVLSKVGLFDENIWPIYCEDIDYIQRLKKSNVELISIQSDVGETRNGSWTIRSDESYARANNVTQKSNQDYITRKWGTEYQYETPFNTGLSVANWTYDSYRRNMHSAHWNNFEETAQMFKQVENKIEINGLGAIITAKNLVTDKNSVHSYCDYFYDKELAAYKDKPVKLLEIGFDQGGSLMLWAEYFTQAEITGVDLQYRGDCQTNCARYPNIKTMLINGYSYEAIEQLGRFDIIIDDGPHDLSSQLFTIKCWSARINPGGILIIEDIASDQNLKMILDAVPFHLKSLVEVVDLRSKKNRYDDLMLVIRYPK